MTEIPLFKSCFSVGKSILTLDEPPKDKKDFDETAAPSIIKIALDNKLKTVYLLEDNMNGYLTAYNKFKEYDLKLRFGVRLTFCDDIEDKSEASLATNHKLIIFARNKAGYYRLLRIVSDAAKEGFYYEARYDLKRLKKEWNKDDLLLCVPFYDSFIENNLTSFTSIVPDISEFNPIFFIEDNDIPLDKLIIKGVKNYAGGRHPTFKTRTIYYEKREDFVAWQSFKCIDKRATLDMPNLDFCSSAEFSFEAWKERNL